MTRPFVFRLPVSSGKGWKSERREDDDEEEADERIWLVAEIGRMREIEEERRERT